MASFYEDRLALVEAYDRAGFYGYHLAEHHGTPLGLAPSPSLFLAAAAQRTRRLRLGAMVFVLSLYHPVRLLEEVCMLDQLSNGRLELGIGRGVSPIELGFFGVSPEEAAELYTEVTEVLLRGGTGGTIRVAGVRFALGEVPVSVSMVQRPHPPLWLGVSRPESARAAGERGVNIACNGPVDAVRRVTDAYRSATRDNSALLAMNRHVVVADTDAEARELARPAYELWHAHLTVLWREHHMTIPLSIPDRFDDAQHAGFCLVGSPTTVRDRVREQVETAGVNYLMCRMAFGDLPRAVSETSVRLFADEVMPAFA